MAFNPFESFRKNGKAIFAILAIACMFTFVLSSGVSSGGDIFDWISRQLGGRDDRGPVMGEIDGTEYYEKNLKELRRRRMAASQFLIRAVDSSDHRMREQIKEDLKTKTFTEKNFPQLIEFALNPNANPQFHNFALQQLGMMRQRMDPKDRTPEFVILERVIKILTDEEDMRPRLTNGFFYNSTPSIAGDAETLRFAMFLREADKMGIKFTDANLQDMINEQTTLPFDREGTEAKKIKAIIQKQLGLSSETIDDAVADEFRVRSAVTILMNIPPALTPYQFFEYYKDNFETVTFDVVDVPVERFLSQVSEEPTDKEIRDLFDLYRKDEYDPAKSTPGFKKPRKLKIEYVGVDSKLPNYQSNSASVIQLQDAGMAVAGLAAATARDMFSGTMSLASPRMAEPLMLQELVGKTRGRPFIFEPIWVPGIGFPQPGDSSIYNPVPDAALAAQLAVMRNPVADLCSATAAYRNLVDTVEIRNRAVVGMQLFAAPLSFNPGNPMAAFAPVAAIGPVVANLPATPKGVYYAQEAETNSKVTRPQRLARADLESLQAKLQEIRKKAQPKPEVPELRPSKKKETPKIDPKVVAEANAEARKLVEEWIKARPGVLTGKSDKPRSKYSIADDPGLKALRELVKRKPLPFQSFEQAFFQDSSRAEPTKDSAAASLYDPKIFPPSESRFDERFPDPFLFSEPVYLAWRIEDELAKAYAKIDSAPPEVRAQVVRAWKFEKARVLAKASADKLAAEIDALGKKELRDASNRLGFDNGVRDLIARGPYSKLLEKITLAKLHKTSEPDFSMQQRPPMPSYEPMRIDKFEIPYPSPGMATQLLDVRNKPLGEVVVMPDQPQSNYYVCLSVEKEVPSISQFYNDVFRTAAERVANGEPAVPRIGRGPRSGRGRTISKEVLDRIQAEMKYKETDELKKQADGRSLPPID